MKLKLLTIFTGLILSLFLTSCVSTGGSGPSAGSKPPVVNPTKTFYLTGDPHWKTIADAKKFFGNSSAVSFTGNTIDLNGSRISGKKLKHPSNSQDEKAQYLKIGFDNLHLTDGSVDDIPGGIMLRGNKARLSKLIFTTRGEDYVSTAKDTVSGIVIDGCKFYNSKGDKSIQLNAAKDAKITNCYITGGQTGIRLQESTSKTKGIKCEVSNTVFDQVPTAINVAGYTTLTVSGNTFKGVSEQYNGGPHTKIIKK